MDAASNADDSVLVLPAQGLRWMPDMHVLSKVHNRDAIAHLVHLPAPKTIPVSDQQEAHIRAALLVDSSMPTITTTAILANGDRPAIDTNVIVPMGE